MKKQIGLFCLLLGFIFSVHAANKAMILNLDGNIGIGTQAYVYQGIKAAAQQQAKLLLIHLDSKAGLPKPTRKIIKYILNSSIPVVTYVTPEKAQATNVATFILFSSHIAAMSPNTTVGSASPVSILRSEGDKPITEEIVSIQKAGLNPNEKRISTAVANSLKGLGELRGRNTEWVEQAVYENQNITAEDALKMNVINVIANDDKDLLQKINGLSVNVNGTMETLDTSDVITQMIKPNWTTKFIALVTDPNVAYILLLLGLYGIFFEFYHPGYLVPAIFGVICLFLALFSFQHLPVNMAGIALLFLGVVFWIFEMLLSSFWILGLAGVISFVLGSILLLSLRMPSTVIAWQLITAMTLFSLGFFLTTVTVAVRRHRRINKHKHARK